MQQVEQGRRQRLPRAHSYRIQEFGVSHLPEIIGDETYALLVDRRLPYQQRRQRLEAVLEERQAVIEAYLTAGFQLEAVWPAISA
ncbi:MAG: hypothetical protein M0Z99_33985 [Betaproteobacteria bacterium]|nr:hypothetical protein [Betaproteobacteria bacterium]